MNKNSYTEPKVSITFFLEECVLTVSNGNNRAIGWNTDWDKNGEYWG